MQKKEEDKKDLQKLNRGGTTLSTLFKGKDGKVNKITQLTHQITQVRKKYFFDLMVFKG